MEVIGLLEKFAFKTLDSLFDRFDRELDELFDDLEKLSKNRKYNWLEAESILNADRYLNFIIETLMGYALDGNVPKNYVDRATKLIEKSKVVREFIYDHFEDVFRRRYTPNFQLEGA